MRGGKSPFRLASKLTPLAPLTRQKGKEPRLPLPPPTGAGEGSVAETGGGRLHARVFALADLRSRR